jgi:penicillin-binding protein 1A
MKKNGLMKIDGSDYDIYKDGLKSTDWFRMQLHAEEAVSAHMANLQQEFLFRQNNKTPLCRYLR